MNDLLAGQALVRLEQTKKYQERILRSWSLINLCLVNIFDQLNGDHRGPDDPWACVDA